MAMVFALHVTLIGTLAPTRARIAPAVRSTPHAPTASFPSAAEGWRRLGAALESPRGAAALAPASCALATLCAPAELWAATPSGYDANSVFDPRGFQPVCGASDGVYRALQGLIQAMVGDASYREYSPLIAGSLLRVRLELCVVESFFNEAIAPFIRERGLSWVLPLHETVETFLAGVVFAVATNFILIGSTKIVTVLVTYADVFFGFPVRLLSGAAWCARRRLAPPPAAGHNAAPARRARRTRASQGLGREVVAAEKRAAATARHAARVGAARDHARSAAGAREVDRHSQRRG